MPAIRRFLFVLSLLPLLFVGHAIAGTIDGAWEGKLETGAATLRVVINVSGEASGNLRATLDSPDQGAFGVPVTSVSFADGELRCSVEQIGATYRGKLDESAHRIDGYWSQLGMQYSLNLTPKEATVLKRPQVPAPPYPYREEEVAFENAKAHAKFAGTLTYPKLSKRAPAVILVTGSGPQNRDEEIMGHKPFLILADMLTRRGIAVLRVDDRGVGGSSGGNTEPTSEELAQDVLAGIEFLKTRKDVDVKHIGIIGHSEGGMIAPLVATQSKDVAFIVLLAGPGVKGIDVLEKQGAAIQAALRTPAAVAEMNARLQHAMFDIAVHSEDATAASAAFDKYWSERSQSGLGAQVPQSTLDTLGKTLKSQMGVLMAPWMQFFLRYDPAPTLEKVRCPVLAINGSLDTQVVASQNLPAIDAALKAGGNKDYSVVELPGLNHLFQTAKTGAPNEYVTIEETMSPSALEAVGDWVVAHSGASAKH